MRLLTIIKNFNMDYNFVKVYSNFKDSKAKSKEVIWSMPIFPAIIYITLTDNSAYMTINNTNSNFDTLYLSYIASKQTQIIICNKLMTKIDKKLDEVYINLWRPYYLLALSNKAYAIILLNAKTRKTWAFYLYFKNEFMNAFQIWLPKIEKENKQWMKTFCTDERKEFISIKLKDICNKKDIIIKYITSYMYEENGLVEWD